MTNVHTQIITVKIQKTKVNCLVKLKQKIFLSKNKHNTLLVKYRLAKFRNQDRDLLLGPM